MITKDGRRLKIRGRGNQSKFNNNAIAKDQIGNSNGGGGNSSKSNNNVSQNNKAKTKRKKPGKP